MNDTRVVLTSEELEGAIQLQAERIIVQGDLAKRANVSLGLQKVPLMRLMILQATLFFAGLVRKTDDVPTQAWVASIVKVDLPLIWSIVALGVPLALALNQGYTAVRFDRRQGDTEVELELVRREGKPDVLKSMGVGLGEGKSRRAEDELRKRELASLRLQHTRSRESLFLIQERKAEFVQETDIPLELVKSERQLTERIAELEGKIQELE